MCQEEKLEDDLLALKIASDASIWGFEDWIKKNRTGNIKINRSTITKKQKWEEKQLYGYFKRQNNEILHIKTWKWLGKGNLNREPESLLIAAQNITTNYVKVKIDNM